MQMLSYQPKNLKALKDAKEYGAEQVRKHPTRFGLLCALPTDEVDARVQEIDRGHSEFSSGGYAVSAVRKGVMLSDERLELVWEKLDSLGATVWSHPNATAPARDGRPSPVIEVAFETCRVVVDIIYRKIFLRYPNIKFIFSHCAGVLPILSGRLELLGAEPWVPNPYNVNSEDIRRQLSSLHVDTAATAANGMQTAVKMVGKDNVIYGSDCGVPCSTCETMETNRNAVIETER